MRRLFSLLVLAVLAVVGFYVVWPAWSGYRIWTALEARDAAALEGKIDFASVRDALRPVVTSEADREIDAQLKQAGGGLGAALGGNFKKEIMPKLVETMLSKVITAENVIRIAAEGGDLKTSVMKILMEQIEKDGGIPGLPGGGGNILGGLGGLAGKAAPLALPGGLAGIPGLGGLPGFGGAKPKVEATPGPTAPVTTTAAPTVKRSFGMGNIKGLGLDGLLGLQASVARDPAATKPEVTAGMRFTGFDWKVTKVVPHL
jgi:Protein of unknown function (DUF2939)